MPLLLLPLDPLLEKIETKNEALAYATDSILKAVAMTMEKQMANLPHSKGILATIYNLAWRPIFKSAH
jgi:hypothetical protein